MTTVLTIVGILCLLAACHPFLTYPWSLDRAAGAASCPACRRGPIPRIA